MRLPLRFLLLLFLLAEIAVLIGVGKLIGVAATLALLPLAAVAGVVLLRRQSVALLVRLRTELAAGRLPARRLAEDAVLAMAALLLILPGFISNVIGILLFMPAARRVLWRLATNRVGLRGAHAGPAAPPASQGGILDLDASDYAAKPRRDSPWRNDGGESS